MTKEEFMKRLEEDEEFSPGWQAIDDAFDEVYPDESPDHYATLLPSRAVFGGEEYLDGYSIYTSPKGYKHLVTYGMTELYGNEEAFGGEYNGWGYEMTMKLKEENSEDCGWALNMMGNLARYTNKTKNYFEANQYVRGNGEPLKLGSDSKITALLLINDTEVKTQDTVYGKTEFIQLVGLTTSEVEAVIADPDNNIPKLLQMMIDDGNPDFVTDMNRQKSYL